MIGSLRAEWLKLWRRPATWALGAILSCAIFSLGYAFLWLSAVIVERTPSSASLPDPAGLAMEVRAGLVPAQFIGATLGLFGSLGGAIAIILGSQALGSEYGWGTLKTILTQGPPRRAIVAAKALMLAAVLLGFTLLALAVGLVSSLIFGAIDGAPLAPPGPGRILAGIGAGWLMLATWTALGLALAALFRGTALAIGVGLVYVLVFESVLGGITTFVEPLQFLERIFVGTNSNALATSFATPGRIPAPEAALVLCLYTTIFLTITALAIQRRDVR